MTCGCCTCGTRITHATMHSLKLQHLKEVNTATLHQIRDT
jgi:hypothetical protein